MNKFKNIAMCIAGVAVAMGGCTSYEIDMPENPTPPTIGREVSTDVIYQANPALFGTQDCLKALTSQLDRIAGMDCDILWVMPVYERGEQNAIGSPYCVKDFTGVNPKYGTLEDVKTLVSTAHSKGMRVIFDWVANHTSWDHPWITQYPDRYVKNDAGQIVSPDGWNDVAQLDFNNPATREAMEEAMLYWVKEVGIDGYRCDFADGVNGTFWTEAITALEGVNADIIMLAETSNPQFYDYGFDMIYDWDSSTTISKAFNGGKPADVVKEAREALARVPEGKSILRYAFNHDVAAENNFDRYFGSVDAIPAAYVCASMLNGTPMIYSGMDATGITGKLSFFDYRSLDFSNSLSAEYKAIDAAFRQTSEVRRGELQDYSNSSVVCFTRRIPGHTLLVAVNVTDQPQKVRTPISIAGATMSDLINGTTVTLAPVIDLEAYGYTIVVD